MPIALTHARDASSLEAQWQSEEIFSDDNAFFGRLLADLQSVRESLDVEIYIFHLDDFGRRMGTCFVGLAQRGVRVRILVDAFGSMESANDLRQFFQGTKVDLGFYHPLIGSWLSGLLRNFNHRNHCKTWILDGDTAFVGSMNISTEYSSSVEAHRKSWKDYGVKVSGPGVATLAAAFDRAWKRRRGWLRKLSLSAPLVTAPDVQSPLVRLNDTFPVRRKNYRGLLRRLYEARNHVWLASAYFVPHPSLVHALCYAAKHGREVRLLVPRHSDIFFMPWLALAYYGILLKAGVAIYEYLPTMFHGKICVVDDWACIGSSNLNYRSLFRDLEVDVEISHPENRRLLEASLKTDFAACQQLSTEIMNQVPKYKMLVAKSLLLFKYWL